MWFLYIFNIKRYFRLIIYLIILVNRKYTINDEIYPPALVIRSFDWGLNFHKKNQKKKIISQTQIFELLNSHKKLFLLPVCKFPLMFSSLLKKKVLVAPRDQGLYLLSYSHSILHLDILNQNSCFFILTFQFLFYIKIPTKHHRNFSPLCNLSLSITVLKKKKKTESFKLSFLFQH